MKLYALCDQATLIEKRISLEKFVTICKKKKADIIQYRCKDCSLEHVKKSIIQLRRLWDKFLIVNDYYEIASFCDGIHLGQDDIAAIDKDKNKAIAILKKVIGNDKIIGLSTHNKAEIVEANTLDINYIGLGAYRNSTTKSVTQTLGDDLDPLASLSKHPVAAIGGVRTGDLFTHVTYLAVGRDLYEH